VTAFIIVCVAMLLAALLWMVLPLLRTPKTPEGDLSSYRKERRISGAVVMLLVPVLATVMYAGLSNWDWTARQNQQADAANMEDAIKRLEAKLADNPKNMEGWLMLGRSYTAIGRYPRAADAFQQAYDLTQGQNIEAIVGLGEALVLTDESSLTGRAGKLFETALVMSPNHPKALWYGSISALRSGDLRQGRSRLQQLLQAPDLPQELRGVLERQIQDLNQQLGEGGQAAPPTAPALAQNGGESAAPAATGGTRSIKVSVSIAPQLQKLLSGTVPLFILARDPAAGGPPLAVQRHSSNDLPLAVELSERDAMIPARSIATVSKVLVVARLSKSGGPQQQSGDLYGEAEYEFGKNSGPLSIIIDRTVP